MKLHTDNKVAAFTSRAAFFFIAHYFVSRASEFYWVSARMGEGIESIPLLAQALRFPLSPFLYSFDYWLEYSSARNYLVLLNSALFAIGATVLLVFILNLIEEEKNK